MATQSKPLTPQQVAALKFQTDEMITKCKKKTAKPDELATVCEKSATWNNHLGTVTHIRPFKEFLLSTSSDGKFTLWKGPQGGVAREWMGESKKLIIFEDYLICISHGNFGSEPGNVKVYDMLKSEWTCMYKGHDLYLTDIAHNGGGWIATASADTTVRLWDFAPTESELHQASDWLEMQVKTPKYTLRAHQDLVNCVLYIGNILYSASADRNIISWNPNASQNKVFSGHTAAVLAITGLPNSSFLFSSSQDCTIRQWNTQTGTQISQIKCKYPIVGLATHNNQVYGWTEGPKFYVVAFDLRTMSYVKFKGPTKRITMVSFTPECMFVSSADGRMWQWDLAIIRCAAQLSVPVNPEGISTFLVLPNGEALVGCNRVIHRFKLLSDDELRSTRPQRQAAAAAVALGTAALASGATLSNSSGNPGRDKDKNKDKEKREKKEKEKEKEKEKKEKDRHRVSTPPKPLTASAGATPYSPSSAFSAASRGSPQSPAPRVAATASGTALHHTDSANSSAGRMALAASMVVTSSSHNSSSSDPMEERFTKQSSFDSLSAAANEALLRAKAEKDRKEREEAEKKAKLAAALARQKPTGDASPDDSAAKGSSSARRNESFSSAALSNSSPGSARAVSNSSPAGSSRAVAAVSPRSAVASPASTAPPAPATSSPSTATTTAAAASASRGGAGRPYSVMSPGGTRAATAAALTSPGRDPAYDSASVLTGPVITATAVKHVYQQAPGSVSPLNSTGTSNMWNSNSGHSPLNSGRTVPALPASDVFAPIPPLSPSSSKSPALSATSSSPNRSIATATVAAAAKPTATTQFNSKTPVSEFMQMVLADMKSFDADKMRSVVQVLQSEAIVEVQDLMLLQDEHYRDLKIPLGLVLRIKAKLRELPPLT